MMADIPFANKCSHPIVSLAITDRNLLYAGYLSFVENGGFFIPSQGKHHLGEELNLFISLMEEQEKFSVNAKVIWVTPNAAQGNRVPGVGVQFQGEAGNAFRERIEGYLADRVNSDKPTYSL